VTGMKLQCLELQLPGRSDRMDYDERVIDEVKTDTC